MSFGLGFTAGRGGGVSTSPQININWDTMVATLVGPPGVSWNEVRVSDGTTTLTLSGPVSADDAPQPTLDISSLVLAEGEAPTVEGDALDLPGVSGARPVVQLATTTLVATPLTVTPTSPTERQAAHFAVSDAAITEMASETGLTEAEVKKQMIAFLDFDDNYTFSSLPTVMRVPRTSGTAIGPYGGHVYRSSGTYSPSVAIYVGAYKFTGSQSLTVSAIDWSSRTIGYVTENSTPEAGMPGGEASDNQYTNLETAWAALEAGTIDTLVLNAGETFTLQNRFTNGSYGQHFYRVKAGQIVTTTGDGSTRAKIVPSTYDDGTTANKRGARTFLNQLSEAGDGDIAGSAIGLDTFLSNASVSTTNRLVFVDGVRQDPASYTLSIGERVVVIDEASQADAPEYSLKMATRQLIAVQAASGSDEYAIIENIEIELGYDPVNPPVWDGENLSTFPHSAAFSAFAVSAVGGSSFDEITFWNCKVSGANVAFDGASSNGSLLGIVNCTATSWYNYGIYWENTTKTMVVGSYLHQTFGALNGTGDKEILLTNRPLYADHGPYRNEQEYEAVINRNFLRSLSQWAGVGSVGQVASQPCLRCLHWAWTGTSVTVTENYGHAPGGPFITVGPPNGAIPYPEFERAWIIGNVAETATGFLNQAGKISCQLNVWVRGENAAFGSPAMYYTSSGVYPFEDGISTEGIFSRNNAIIVRDDRPTGNFRVGSSLTVSDGSLVNLVGTSSTASGGETELDVACTYDDYQAEPGMVFSVWRSADGSAASAVRTGATSVTLRDTLYTVSHEPDDTAATVTVTLASGTFSAGEKIFLTSEWTLGTFTPGSSSDTFFGNKQSITIDEPMIINDMVILEGDWDEAYLLTDDGVIDPADYRGSRYAPLSDVYVPLSGSGALSDGALASRVYVDADLTERSNGAFPVAVGPWSVSAPVVETAFYDYPVTTLDWETDPAVSDTVTYATYRDFTITDAGFPLYSEVVGAGSVVLVRGGEVSVETSVTVQAGDGLALRYQDESEALGTIYHETELKVVLDPLNFSPSQLFSGGYVDGGFWDPSDTSTLWQDTAGTSPVTADGQSVARIDDKSGNGYHLIAPSGEEPTYKTDGSNHWLEFDPGSSDELAVLTTGSKALPRAMIFGARNSSATSRMYGFWYDFDSNQNSRFSAGLVDNGLVFDAHDVTPGDGRSTKAVTASGPYILLANCTDDSRILRRDGVEEIDAGAFNKGAEPVNNLSTIRFAASGSVVTQWVGGCMIERQLTTQEVGLLEEWFADKAGVTL